MPQYKLVYFNVRARAEISRYLFAQAGVEYEDCRLNSEEFEAMKKDASKLPLGQLPVLVVDGERVIPQSQAIARYLAKQFGMYGKNVNEETTVDVLTDCVADIFTKMIKVSFEKDEATKKELSKNFMEKDSVAILTFMETTLKKNGEGKGFFVGDKMTLADIAVFTLSEMLDNGFPGLMDKYPLLKDFAGRVRAQPKIAAWIAKRPESSF
nr:S-crystallin SL11-like [Lytechinus pictus]